MMSDDRLYKSDDDLKREEAVLRLREAWDYVKTQIFTESFSDAIGSCLVYEPNYADVSAEFSEDSLFVYRIQFSVKEII